MATHPLRAAVLALTALTLTAAPALAAPVKRGTTQNDVITGRAKADHIMSLGGQDRIRGYGGDVWIPQPAPKDHVLRYAKNPFGGGNAMVPHMSGTSLDAQKRYAIGTKNILESYLTGKHDYRPEDLIVYKGDYATKSYGQRTAPLH